jgi:hypothetical protein
LWYLFFLTTVVAAVVGVVRLIIDTPWLAVGLVIYLLGFGGYLLLRVPWLIGPLAPERERLRENRRRLAQWADERRHQERDAGDGV